jgi:hypothetical protein
MKNPEVIDLQPYLLRHRAKAIEIKEIPELVKVKKKGSHFLKIAITIIFLIAIASLIKGTLTNEGSQVQSTSYISGSFLLEDKPGYQKGIYG